MTSMAEREDAKWQRDRLDKQISALGHDIDWKLAPNATRAGHAYGFVGTCRNCGAQPTVGASWSSSQSHVDARKEQCGGPGTAILTEIEAERLHDLIGEAVSDFGAAVRRNLRGY